MKLEKSNCDEPKNSNCEKKKTQQLKLWQNSQIQNVTNIKNSSCDKTQILTKVNNSKCDETQIVTKLKKSNCDKTFLNLWQNLNYSKYQF